MIHEIDNSFPRNICLNQSHTCIENLFSANSREKNLHTWKSMNWGRMCKYITCAYFAEVKVEVKMKNVFSIGIAIILTFLMSEIFVNCLPNSHKSTPSFKAQLRTLQWKKRENFKWKLRHKSNFLLLIITHTHIYTYSLTEYKKRTNVCMCVKVLIPWPINFLRLWLKKLLSEVIFIHFYLMKASHIIWLYIMLWLYSTIGIKFDAQF